MTTAREPQLIKEALTRFERKTRKVTTSLVTGRERDGRLKQQEWDGDGCETSGAVARNAAGSFKQSAPREIARTGTTGVATLSATATHTTVLFRELDPDLYAPGSSYTVTATGVGFREGMTIEFLLPDSEEVNDAITVDEVRLIDDTTLEIDITVDPAAEPLGQPSRLAYDLGSGS